MRKLRRLGLLFSLLTIAVCIVLLLNITAPNPTGRRYSSDIPLMLGSAQSIGSSAENILSRDLGVPRNDTQRQCICNVSYQNTNTTPNECRVCLAYMPLNGTNRRPDFISAGYIAESKNRRELLYSYADQADQIRDYAEAARLLQRPLWLYTRVDTLMSPEFRQIVESTGGGVVPYFVTAGYVDPIDTAAQGGLIGAGVVFGGLLMWEARANHRPKAPKPPRRPKRPQDPAKEAEALIKRRKDRLYEEL